ncbi:3',5'-cyclic-nucleotide phosphodiesterase [bacterium]|nr:3',5'-cyclic-nucleotide phosphodiesterase [bacterium]
MKITVLGASGGEAPGHNLTGFLIDNTMLVDAGTIGSKLGLEQQKDISDVLITHAHLDHIHSLPFLLDNLIGRISGPVNVYGLSQVLETIQKNIFNNKIWPDFTVLPTPENPILRFNPLVANQLLKINGYTVEPIAVDHSFAALGYIISDENGSVAFTGDTGPTLDLWKKLSQKRKIHAIFMECSFSDEQKDLARMTKHLATGDIPTEVAKTGRSGEMPVYLYHLKPQFAQIISEEVTQMEQLKIHIAKSGDEFHFLA